MKVFYTTKMVVDQGQQGLPDHVIQSPSARKPAELLAQLRPYADIECIEPGPLTVADLKLCHDGQYVDDIMNLVTNNGFGNKSRAVADSLLYTNGAMYHAAKAAVHGRSQTCALVSGFHHAGYDSWALFGYFCTFNGLMITAVKLLNEGCRNIAIIDGDMHWGNGTDDILKVLNVPHILHITFGKSFTGPQHATAYLDSLRPQGLVHTQLAQQKPDVILYQAGADVHIDDPYGGVFTTAQIKQRDTLMFTMAKELNIPICWNLAGGYQVENDGSIQKVLDIHLNTFQAWREVYLP
jgi:acetoin utilization deacetylase AcuC-like enzyme